MFVVERERERERGREREREPRGRHVESVMCRDALGRSNAEEFVGGSWAVARECEQ